MREGKYIKSLIQLNLSWTSNYLNYVNHQPILRWHNYYVSSLLLHKTLNNLLITPLNTNPNFSNIKYLLLYFLYKIQPIFLLYIYRVNKGIYKSTRGKLGKYTFILKYIPSYKRSPLVMTWLIKELKISLSKKIRLRLYELINSLIKSPHKTWIWRMKYFSYNYVYYNCRKTLANSYISTVL